MFYDIKIPDSTF